MDGAGKEGRNTAARTRTATTASPELLSRRSPHVCVCARALVLLQRTSSSRPPAQTPAAGKRRRDGDGGEQGRGFNSCTGIGIMPEHNGRFVFRGRIRLCKSSWRRE